jgi:hypothetical protein
MTAGARGSKSQKLSALQAVARLRIYTSEMKIFEHFLRSDKSRNACLTNSEQSEQEVKRMNLRNRLIQRLHPLELDLVEPAGSVGQRGNLQTLHRLDQGRRTARQFGRT